MIGSPSDMGRELAVLWQRAHEANMDEFNTPQHDALMDRIDALEALIVNSRAVSKADILAQLVLATDRASHVVEYEPSDKMPETGEDIRKLLLSAVAAFERLHGLDRDSVGAGGARHLDPHLVANAA